MKNLLCGKTLFFFVFIPLFTFAHNTFTGTVLDDEGQPLYGATVIIKDSINGTINYQWDQSFTSNNTTFPGAVDEKSLFDVTLGFVINKNVMFELAGINVLNNKFRALPGFPRIGRTITARLLVDF